MAQAFNRAEYYGLSSASYRTRLSAAQLERIANGMADSELQHRYDQELSELAGRFASHLHHGRIAPRAAGFDLPAAGTDTDGQFVEQLAGSNDLQATFASIEPQMLPYQLLKQALVRYRQLASERTVAPLPALPGRTLKPGDVYEGAAQLRRQLILLGDLPEATRTAASESNIIDPELAQALEQFQARHGLGVDGALGRQTLAALNVPIQQRVRQIELSMERWRWLNAGSRPDIVINVPQFMLYALPRPHRAEEQLLEMPVIVGRTGDRTPVFSAPIEEVVFNPYWDVPASILQKELLPKIRKDVSYLERHHFEIVRGPGDDARVQQPTPAVISALAAGELRLRQRPGADNALGPVKFILPNRYSIRLHGTSEPRLFNSVQRALSHGCIRVSDPAALAEYVLANARGEWDSATIQTALCGETPRRVRLEKPVQVLVFYATAAATRSRGVLFTPDLYGHDARLEKLLADLEPS
jgi:murein L,D-transpeptidase YcbB/YkuD